MTKRSFLLASLAPALLLGGCGGTRNLGVESVHQPVVSRTDYAFDLATAGGALGSGERQRLAGWIASLRLAYGDRVAIDDPSYEGSVARGEIAQEVARHGLLLSSDTPVTAAPVAPGTIRVVVSRMTATVPGCPDYSRDPSHDFEGHTSSNYGCATNSSLAAMVARPEDLVLGRTGSTTDPAVSTKAIDSFRKAAPSGAGGALKSAGGN